MNYLDFEIEDFAQDESFVAWVLDSNSDTKDFWENFRLRNPALEFKIEKAKELVLSIKDAEQTSHSSLQINDLWNRIDAELRTTSGSYKTQRKYFSYWKIAASISAMVLLTIGIIYSYSILTPQNIPANLSVENNFIEEVNTTGNLLKIHLSDGSIISLENNSRLRYPKDFTMYTNREVYLDGEGFFDVAKNSKQPFLVHTKEITTKVLGTSFRIKALEHEKDIVVAVKEGKVTVFSSHAVEHKTKEHEEEVNGVVLTPNQQVIYSRSEDSFNKTLIEKPEVVTPDKTIFNFNFENTPVKEVFAALEEAYGVEIIFDEEAMQHCYLTVPLGNEPLYEKLRIICRTIGASYELIDASLVMTGEGC